MKPCQKIKSKNQLAGIENNMIDTICSDAYRQLANYVYDQRSDLYQEKWNYQMAPAWHNVYYPFMEIEFSFPLLCAGIEIKNPQIRFDDERFVIFVEKRPAPSVGIDMYCDNMYHELVDSHPDLLRGHPESTQRVWDTLLPSSDPDYEWYHYAWPMIFKNHWWPARDFDLMYVSPFLHMASTHHAHRRTCQKLHPEHDDFKCAVAYSLAKKHDDHDRIMDTDRAFVGYPDDWTMRAPHKILRTTAKCITYIGLLFHMLQIQIPKGLMLFIMCTVNVLL